MGSDRVSPDGGWVFLKDLLSVENWRLVSLEDGAVRELRWADGPGICGGGGASIAWYDANTLGVRCFRDGERENYLGTTEGTFRALTFDADCEVIPSPVNGVIFTRCPSGDFLVRPSGEQVAISIPEYAADLQVVSPTSVAGVMYEPRGSRMFRWSVSGSESGHLVPLERFGGDSVFAQPTVFGRGNLAACRSDFVVSEGFYAIRAFETLSGAGANMVLSCADGSPIDYRPTPSTRHVLLVCETELVYHNVPSGASRSIPIPLRFEASDWWRVRFSRDGRRLLYERRTSRTEVYDLARREWTDAWPGEQPTDIAWLEGFDVDPGVL